MSRTLYELHRRRDRIDVYLHDGRQRRTPRIAADMAEAEARRADPLTTVERIGDDTYPFRFRVVTRRDSRPRPGDARPCRQNGGLQA